RTAAAQPSAAPQVVTDAELAPAADKRSARSTDAEGAAAAHADARVSASTAQPAADIPSDAEPPAPRAVAPLSILRRDAIDAVELRVLVEGALRHLNDMPTLSQHPLLHELPTSPESPATPLERAATLRQELDQAIERLRPPGQRPTPGASVIGGWLH